jgi:DNA-binding transcriptional LysR family regulator
MSIGYEAELHSPARRARRRGGVPERCAVQQLSPSGCFIRTTRSVGLTEAGERFLSRAKPAFEELVAAGEAARDLGQRPAGLLRLSVPRAVVPLILEPVIASFCRAYPEIELRRSKVSGLHKYLARSPRHRLPTADCARF